RMKNFKKIISPFLLLIILSPSETNAQTKTGQSKDWVAKSNSYTKLLIDVDKKYSPESASQQGLAFYDTLISVPTLANEAEERKDKENLVAQLKAAQQTETILPVKQDLDILIKSTELGFKNDDFDLDKRVSFLNASEVIFSGLQTLLDDQTPPVRRDAAVVRLRKYAGLQNGYEPLTSIFKERTQTQMNKPGMIYPSVQSTKLALSRNASLINGIAVLFKKYKIKGWEKSYAVIKKQLEDYDSWIKTTVLPKGRKDYRLPPEEYQLALEGYGIDIPSAEIASMAHAMYTDIQKQMKPVAAEIANKYKLPSSDYRDVIRFLKRNQLIGDS